jgi:hypothetical protein
MKNSIIQSLISSNPGAVFLIRLKDNNPLWVGYSGTSSLKESEIEFTTMDGVELLKIHMVDRSRPTPKPELKYTIYIESTSVDWVGVMDPGYEEYRPEPNHFK